MAFPSIKTIRNSPESHRGLSPEETAGSPYAFGTPAGGAVLRALHRGLAGVPETGDLATVHRFTHPGAAHLRAAAAFVTRIP
ncbi:hypothetical protein GCM10018962_51170 [Dactylosporangium matsuzakiense]|uniref:Uncharacterized protein n=1 Tax=Dactylosporangium matsuzakiense TaxID=53360 RepID=A0A9W6KHX7_9ACTN|nr:hypothetical protein GCM10017581_041440 [Dactylosporangium matsuzakiense]